MIKAEQRNWKHYFIVGMMWMLFMISSISTHAYAAEYTITPISAVLYTGSGAELFAAPDPTTLVMVLDGNLPVQITGMTDTGYYQVVFGQDIYYMYGKALSVATGTKAYTLTTIAAREALVGDAVTGSVIYASNATESMAPASTTKIMTALLTLDAVAQGTLTMDTPIVVSPTALANMPGDASHISAKLQAGEIMNVTTLLECVMLESDCYACNVLAEAVAGSVDNFVALMNARAAALGCTGTHFMNTSGYPAEGHVSTAYDLFLITREALKYPVFEYIVSLPAVEIPATNMTGPRTLKTTNALLTNPQYYNPYAFGIKTGSAASSGLCFVSGARKDGKTIITVILGAATNTMTDGVRLKQQFSETNKLISIGLAAN